MGRSWGKPTPKNHAILDILWYELVTTKKIFSKWMPSEDLLIKILILPRSLRPRMLVELVLFAFFLVVVRFFWMEWNKSLYHFIMFVLNDLSLRDWLFICLVWSSTRSTNRARGEVGILDSSLGLRLFYQKSQYLRSIWCGSLEIDFAKEWCHLYLTINMY